MSLPSSARVMESGWAGRCASVPGIDHSHTNPCHSRATGPRFARPECKPQREPGVESQRTRGLRAKVYFRRVDARRLGSRFRGDDTGFCVASADLAPMGSAPAHGGRWKFEIPGQEQHSRRGADGSDTHPYTDERGGLTRICIPSGLRNCATDRDVPRARLPVAAAQKA